MIDDLGHDMICFPPYNLRKHVQPLLPISHEAKISLMSELPPLHVLKLVLLLPWFNIAN